MSFQLERNKIKLTETIFAGQLRVMRSQVVSGDIQLNIQYNKVFLGGGGQGPPEAPLRFLKISLFFRSQSWQVGMCCMDRDFFQKHCKTLASGHTRGDTGQTVRWY